jgi:glyoxylase I family protein
MAVRSRMGGIYIRAGRFNTSGLMQRVTGIGGFFFRAKEPAALSEWYKRHLGIDLVPADYSQKPWSQGAGPTVFAPFPQDSDYFGNPDKNWMINLRVRDLDAMVEQFRAANINVKVDPETYPNGRFARLHDPEGNPIELWEPK